jgi:hypothetical protein
MTTCYRSRMQTCAAGSERDRQRSHVDVSNPPKMHTLTNSGVCNFAPVATVATVGGAPITPPTHPLFIKN